MTLIRGDEWWLRPTRFPLADWPSLPENHNYQDPLGGYDFGWRGGRPPTIAYYGSPAELANTARTLGISIEEIRRLRQPQEDEIRMLDNGL